MGGEAEPSASSGGPGTPVVIHVMKLNGSSLTFRGDTHKRVGWVKKQITSRDGTPGLSQLLILEDDVGVSQPLRNQDRIIDALGVPHPAPEELRLRLMVEEVLQCSRCGAAYVERENHHTACHH